MKLEGDLSHNFPVNSEEKWESCGAHRAGRAPCNDWPGPGDQTASCHTNISQLTTTQSQCNTITL